MIEITVIRFEYDATAQARWPTTHTTIEPQSPIQKEGPAISLIFNSKATASFPTWFMLKGAKAKATLLTVGALSMWFEVVKFDRHPMDMNGHNLNECARQADVYPGAKSI